MLCSEYDPPAASSGSSSSCKEREFTLVAVLERSSACLAFTARIVIRIGERKCPTLNSFDGGILKHLTEAPLLRGSAFFNDFYLRVHRLALLVYHIANSDCGMVGVDIRGVRIFRLQTVAVGWGYLTRRQSRAHLLSLLGFRPLLFRFCLPLRLGFTFRALAFRLCLPLALKFQLEFRLPLPSRLRLSGQLSL